MYTRNYISLAATKETLSSYISMVTIAKLMETVEGDSMTSRLHALSRRQYLYKCNT